MRNSTKKDPPHISFIWPPYQPTNHAHRWTLGSSSNGTSGPVADWVQQTHFLPSTHPALLGSWYFMTWHWWGRGETRRGDQHSRKEEDGRTSDGTSLHTTYSTLLGNRLNHVTCHHHWSAPYPLFSCFLLLDVAPSLIDSLRHGATAYNIYEAAMFDVYVRICPPA